MWSYPKDLGGVVVAILGTLCFGALFRIGWEIGGKLWGAF